MKKAETKFNKGLAKCLLSMCKFTHFHFRSVGVAELVERLPPILGDQGFRRLWVQNL